MLSAMLLPLLLAGNPVEGTRVQSGDDPPVQLWISNDRRFLPGDRAKVHVRAEEDGYLLVLHSDPDGHLRVLFPIDPDDDNFVRGGKRYEVRGRGDREAFSVDVSSGRGTVYAAYSRAPFGFQGYVLGDHWDYRALTPDRLPREPETELTEIVRRMAGGSFDYDILTYDVIERVVYADDHYHSRPYYNDLHYGSYYDDPWCGGSYFRRCGGGLSVGIFIGSPYRPYYRPYHYGYYPAYDPFFYDPFFYDRYYYRPVRYYPYYGYHRPYYSRYRDYYGWRRHERFGRPYTPYRFRGADGVRADFDNRNYGFRRAVNTVYNAPVTRAREPENAQPVRRLVDDPSRAGPADAENRRDGGRRVAREAPPSAERTPEARPSRERETGERRSVAERPQPDRQRIEARRAREPERTGSVSPDSRERREGQAGERRDLPVEVGRPAVERRAPEREPVRVERPRQPEARPAARTADRPAPARAEPRSADRGGGGARSASPPRSSPSGDGGGRRRR